MGTGKAEIKRCAFIFFSLYPDGAAMLFYDSFHNSQTNAGSCIFLAGM
jgi:hypothetical protein